MLSKLATQLISVVSRTESGADTAPRVTVGGWWLPVHKLLRSRPPADRRVTAADQRARTAHPIGFVNAPRVSVVIPTLNEAANLPHVLPYVPHWVDEVVIVDGRSTDDTIEVARRLRDDVKVVLERRCGKGAALRAGFEAASGDIIIMLDADGSMNPQEAIMFVGALLSGADFVKGSRFLQGGGTSDMSLLRMFGNWCLTKTVKILYGGSYTDLCYGYAAFWARSIRLLDLDSDGFEIETQMNVRALLHQLKIVEVPSFEADRVHGVSNLRTFPDGWRVLRTILRERLARPRFQREVG
jgi:glycosyltransferase involved in cell wall biosynthesis